MTIADQLIQAAEELRARVRRLRFADPVAHVYNPLLYAWAAHQEYLARFGNSRKRVLFIGMNPGPFGMVQTGVPFGEVQVVRNWMRIHQAIGQPPHPHPRRPVLGLDCPRSEVSGRRLWGLFARRFGKAEEFFANHFVFNYCPLAFLESSGCNRTPNKLPASELIPLREACDAHLRRVTEILEPEWLIGIGRFAETRVQDVFRNEPIQIGSILHPSPASPASNRDWEGTVTEHLEAIGVWRRGPKPR